MLGVFGTTLNYYFRNNEYRNIRFSLENKSLEFLQKMEGLQDNLKDMNNNVSEIKKLIDVTKRESWYEFFKRKTIVSYRYCTGNLK